MKADIITIGDEILIGQIINSNSSYLGSELTQIGFEIRRMISIPDREADIREALDESIEHANLVILTGGLGPTNDDLTKETLNAYFKGKLHMHEPSQQHIERMFAKRGYQMTERNQEQAMVPDTCIPLLNEQGTAPGMLFKRGGKLIFSVPGVPYEMKWLYKNALLPEIQKHYTLPVRMHTTVHTCGGSESAIADRLKDFEANLAQKIKLAYLPSPGILRLRLSISGDNNEQLKTKLNDKVQEMVRILGNDLVFGYDSDSLSSVVGKLLKRRSGTLSIAESCTGGKIASLLTSVSGASEFFKGSITSYANEIKQDILKVDSNIIEAKGAVSQEVVEQMATEVKTLMNTDFAVATSGIAGPTGGTADKPVGTIWIAIACPEEIISRTFLFGDNRERNILRTSNTALNMLRICLQKYTEK